MITITFEINYLLISELEKQITVQSNREIEVAV